MSIPYFLDKIREYKTIVGVLAAISLSLILCDIIPTPYKIMAYTLSHNIKNILMFLIPFFIFPFLVESILEIKAKGALLIPFILLLVFGSNFTSFMIAYSTGINFIPIIGGARRAAVAPITDEGIVPLYDLILPEIVSIPKVMILAVLTGLISCYAFRGPAAKFLGHYRHISIKFFEKVFLPLLPIYIFGSMLKMNHEIDFISLLPTFGETIGAILCIQLTYIGFLFFVGNKGDISRTFQSIKTALPAGLVGFSTLSSLITMPVTLKAAEKNTRNPAIAKVTVTTTVNCHDIGECISLPILALAILYINGLNFPDLATYAWLAFLLSCAQFSAASVPGGSIVIMLPFLTSHLGFTDEMASLLIALSTCTDPMGTAGNVMGNNAFVILMDQLYHFFKKLDRKLAFRKAGLFGNPQPAFIDSKSVPSENLASQEQTS